MKTVFGIDCGTQSTKVIAYDADSKKVLARSQSAHELISRDDGSREQEASWWIDALKDCFSQIPADIRQGGQAAGVSGQQHGFVPVDEEGQVLYPAKLWCDTSTIKECDEIIERFGGEADLIKDVGNSIPPGFTASKILWLKNNQPELYKKLDKILLPHDYLNYYLTGKMTMEWGDASGTALLNIRTRDWDDKVLKALDPDRDLRGMLPRLIKPSEAAGHVTAETAKELGIPEGIPVSCGGGDNMMGAIGTGNNMDGVLTVSLGTSGTLYGYSNKPIMDPDGILAAFCSSTGGWLPLLCTMNCTVGTELIRELLGADLGQLEQMAAASPIGSDGVLTIPYYNGERAPNLPNGKGTITGLTPDNMKKENFLRSAMESGIFGIKYGLDSFQKLGFKASGIRLIGGGSKSALWRQITADILELPIVCPAEEEAAALGGALQALYTLASEKGSSDITAIIEEHVAMDETTRHEPGIEAATKYAEHYQDYLKYMEQLSPVFR